MKGKTVQVPEYKTTRITWRHGLAISLLLMTSAAVAADDWWSSHVGNDSAAPQSAAKAKKPDAKVSKAAMRRNCEKRADNVEGAKLTGTVRMRFVETCHAERK